MDILFGDAVNDYTTRGWSIIPIRSGDKRPLIRWEEFQHRQPSAEEVRAWLSCWPEAGIGIVTGRISGIVVVDIDPHHGGDASLDTLERQHDHMPLTVECCSGGSGRHLYFAHPGGLVRNKVALAAGVDLRGDGGYVVAPPSMHGSGARYVWRDGCGPRDMSLAPLPAWLLRSAIEEVRRAGRPASHWRRLVRDGVSEGERNNTVASLAGHLMRHGVDGAVVLELLLCWNRLRCKPPIHDDEVAAVIESIGRLHARQEQRRAPHI